MNRAGVDARGGQRGGVQVLLDTPAGPQRIEGQRICSSPSGRVPNTDRLNLAAAGLATDKPGFIPVNNRLETSVPGIYAIGDVKGGPAFTHISYDDYRILRANWLENGAATTDGRLVPNTMFIDPQLATVGLNETEAARRGIAYKVAKIPMTYVARAIEMGETRGFMKAIVDPRVGRDPRLHDARHRGRRADVDARDRDAREGALPGAPRGDLRPPDARRVAQHSLRLRAVGPTRKPMPQASHC